MFSEKLTLVWFVWFLSSTSCVDADQDLPSGPPLQCLLLFKTDVGRQILALPEPGIEPGTFRSSV